MQKNKEEKTKLDQEKHRRAKEWDMVKRKKRNELKSKAEYNAWVDKEKPLLPLESPFRGYC